MAVGLGPVSVTMIKQYLHLFACISSAGIVSCELRSVELPSL